MNDVKNSQKPLPLDCVECNFSDSSFTEQPIVAVVEDHEDSVEIVSCILDSMGYRRLVATCASDLLHLLSTTKPDLILLDLRLPDMNGIELIEIIRRKIQLVNIPIIAVTALVTPTIREIIMDKGFTDYLLKPFSLIDFQKLIRRYLS